MPEASTVPKRTQRKDKRTILCQNCSQSSVIPHSGMTLSTGCERNVCDTCDELVVGNGTTCAADPKHTVTEYLVCLVCGASGRRNQTVDIGDAAVPASDSTPCVNDTSDCTPHRVRATCGHVYCSTCLMTSVTDYLQPANTVQAPGCDAHDRTRFVRLARSFRADPAGYLVPPCLLCRATGIPFKDDTCDTLFLAPMRALSREGFSNLKDVAGCAFHERQRRQLELNELRR
jgi:hypothetical protein